MNTNDFMNMNKYKKYTAYLMIILLSACHSIPPSPSTLPPANTAQLLQVSQLRTPYSI